MADGSEVVSDGSDIEVECEDETGNLGGEIPANNDLLAGGM